MSSSVSRFRTERDCFSPEVYEPNPLWGSTAKRPSGERGAAGGRLLIGRGCPGTAVSSLPFGRLKITCWQRGDRDCFLHWQPSLPRPGVTKRISKDGYMTGRGGPSNFGDQGDAREAGNEEWTAKGPIVDQPWKRLWHWNDPCRPSRANRPLYHSQPVPHIRLPRKMGKHTVSLIAPSI